MSERLAGFRTPQVDAHSSRVALEPVPGFCASLRAFRPILTEGLLGDGSRTWGYDWGMIGPAILVLIGASCPPASEPVPELELRMAELVNVEREARGLAPLALSPALADIGREYSAKMAEARAVHHDLDPRPVEERVRASLPDTCTFGENLSRHTTIDYSLGDLMASPGHRANILSERFTLLGIGIARGDDGFLYITQELARPCDPPPKGSKRRKNFPQ